MTPLHPQVISFEVVLLEFPVWQGYLWREHPHTQLSKDKLDLNRLIVPQKSGPKATCGCVTSELNHTAKQ